MAIEQKSFFKGLVLATVIILAFWLFGQLYEAVVYSPNWVVEPVEQIKRLNDFYVVTSARNYFDPVVPLGVLLLWILFFATKDRIIKRKLRLPFLFSVLAMVVNIYIIVALLVKIFSENYWNDEAILKGLLVQWNIMNLARIILIAISLYYTFQLFRYLDRNPNR